MVIYLLYVKLSQTKHINRLLDGRPLFSLNKAEKSQQFYWSDSDTPPEELIKNVLRRTRDEVVESYASRFNYLRQLIDSDS